MFAFSLRLSSSIAINEVLIRLFTAYLTRVSSGGEITWKWGHREIQGVCLCARSLIFLSLILCLIHPCLFLFALSLSLLPLSYFSISHYVCRQNTPGHVQLCLDIEATLEVRFIFTELTSLKWLHWSWGGVLWSVSSSLIIEVHTYRHACTHTCTHTHTHTRIHIHTQH